MRECVRFVWVGSAGLLGRGGGGSEGFVFH